VGISRLPEVGSHRRDRPSIEIYRSVSGTYSWRVVALAEDDSEDALREAKAVALRVAEEIQNDIGEANKRRRHNGGSDSS